MNHKVQFVYQDRNTHTWWALAQNLRTKVLVDEINKPLAEANGD